MIKNRIRIVLRLNIGHSREPLSELSRNVFAPYIASAQFYDLFQHEFSCKSAGQWKFTDVKNTQLDKIFEFYLLWLHHCDSKNRITASGIPFCWAYWLRNAHKVSVIILTGMLVVNTLEDTIACDAFVLNEEADS